MTRCRTVALVLVSTIILGTAAPLRAGDDSSKNADAKPDPRQSIVHITTTKRGPMPTQPWTKSTPQDSTGTGFVVEGNRILTNAHVVGNGSQIYVQPYQSADKLRAEIVLLAPEMDMALLSVENEADFFATRPPLPRAAKLPALKSSVALYGFPVGGEQLSVTQGVVSRIEFVTYYQSGLGLRIQIDAAMNPGNSGGPALLDGVVAGMAFAAVTSAENIGYLIPAEEIETFLADAKDGVYDGKPRLFESWQTVENDALRARLKLPKSVAGVMVTRHFEGAVDTGLRAGDCITHIGDHALDSSGRIKVTDELRLPFFYMVPQLAKNGKVPLTVWRDGQELKADAPVSAQAKLLAPYLKYRYPRYFIYGPLVFSQVYADYALALEERWLKYLRDRNSPILTRVFEPPAFEGEELVAIMSPQFSHPITKGYSQQYMCVVSKINGTKVKNLQHAVELLRDATGEYTEVEFADRSAEKFVFRRRDMDAATDEILADNSIRKQCSDDLVEVWNGGKPLGKKKAADE
ncbi:MAG: trypsin-like peptidase domain-containing protein [Planctomycetes bacterium]|nr:trypsin-like peptidase domain-containing protein [Planctomycetota bacterium]